MVLSFWQMEILIQICKFISSYKHLNQFFVYPNEVRQVAFHKKQFYIDKSGLYACFITLNTANSNARGSMSHLPD